MSSVDALRDLLARRIIVLDGAMGTMVQGLGLAHEELWRGDRFRDHAHPLKGCTDILAVTNGAAIEGMLNFVGGCCGTRPDHIKAIRAAVEGVAPRSIAKPARYTRLSGLEPLTITPETNFIVIGERTNLTGSAIFRRLIKEEKYDEAVAVARQQVEGGANILDVCMDE